jgi:hypothetical protein
MGYLPNTPAFGRMLRTRTKRMEGPRRLTKGTRIMRSEVLTVAVGCLALFTIAGVITGRTKGPEWGIGVFAVGVCLAFLFPWDVLFN